MEVPFFMLCALVKVLPSAEYQKRNRCVGGSLGEAIKNGKSFEKNILNYSASSTSSLFATTRRAERRIRSRSQ